MALVWSCESHSSSSPRGRVTRANPLKTLTLLHQHAIMDIMTPNEHAATNEPLDKPVDFPESRNTVLCSTLRCSKGHLWLPKLAIGTCPGCKAPVLAVKMESCPFCNEPSIQASIRCDHFSRNEYVQPLCQGANTTAEITMLDFPLEHAAQTEMGNVASKITLKRREEVPEPTPGEIQSKNV